MISRRGLLIGASSLIAAPAIVRAENIMRISDPLVTGILINDKVAPNFGLVRPDLYVAFDPYGVTRTGYLYNTPKWKPFGLEFPKVRLSEFTPLIDRYKDTGWFDSYKVIY
jgi:hypothetical protein